LRTEKSISTKNKKENKEKYSKNGKLLWKNPEYVEKVIGPQRLKYNEKLLAILSDFIKQGKKNSTQILPIINNPENEFYKIFYGENKNNKQFISKFIEITHENLTKLVEHFGYECWRDFKKKAEFFNHKIVSVEFLTEKQDTGTITVDGEEKYHNFHNFALSVGIFTQNSNLDQISDIEYLQNKLFAALKVPKPYLNYAESMPGGSMLSQVDLRFARTINRIQEFIVMELRRIANIHLYILGFEDDIDNFTLSLTNPSTQQELLKLETMKARLEVFKEMFTNDPTSPVSYTWAMQNIMGFSEAEIKQVLRQKKVERKVFAEIEGAANEYKETGFFYDLDKKFRKPDFVPGQEGGVPKGGEAAGSESGGGGGFGGGSTLSGLGGISSGGAGDMGGGGMETGGGLEGGAETTPPAETGGAEEVAPEAGGEETLAERNTLLAKNKHLNFRTKTLLERIERSINKSEEKNSSTKEGNDKKEII
jgi:hypothetical protein